MKHKSMQFADYVVSHALQTLSRCLQKVGDYEHSFQCSDEKSLALSAERLLSLWQMMQWSVGKLQYERARADLSEIVRVCSGLGGPQRRGAERLLERADDKTAEALQTLLRGLPESRAVLDRDLLSCLLQAESERWRDYALLRQVSVRDLVDHGMLRAFEKSVSLNAKLDRIDNAAWQDLGARVSQKRLKRAARWVGHCVNHLELLRPALSESGRTRRWHLNRLSAKLDEQWELEAFAQATGLTGLGRKSNGRVVRLVQVERGRLDKQRRKLTVGAFDGGDKAFHGELIEAVEQLGLKEITLIEPDQGERAG